MYMCDRCYATSHRKQLLAYECTYEHSTQLQQRTQPEWHAWFKFHTCHCGSVYMLFTLYNLHTVRSDKNYSSCIMYSSGACCVYERSAWVSSHLSEEIAPISLSVPSDSHRVWPVFLVPLLWSPAMTLLWALWESEGWKMGKDRAKL